MIYLLFLLTGACALVYEVVWSRQFGLLFGHTAQAAAVVLGSYFSGMTIGYLLAARLAGRLARPLRGYAIAEIIAALWSLAIPLLLGTLATGALAALLNNDNTTLQVTMRALLSFLLMLPATAALGASLPFVVQHLACGGGDHTHRITLAYSFNTLGAFGGVMLATFVLILKLGIQGSLHLAVAIALVCGIAAWLLPAPGATADSAVPEPAAKQVEQRLPLRWYLLAGLSGFCMLAVQVLYNSMFSLVFHNSTYSFGAIIAVFLAALALAGWLVSKWPAMHLSQRSARAALLSAVAILLGVLVFQRSTRLGYLGVSVPLLGGDLVDHSFLGYMLAATLLIVISIGLPVVAAGTLLPMCLRRLQDHAADSGRLVGRLVALNTVCAAAGALSASFIMLPLLGLWHSFMLLSMLYLLFGLALLWRDDRLGQLSSWGAVSLAACLALAWFTNWPVVTKAGRKLMVQETAYGVVSVVEVDVDGEPELYLRQNNHYTLGATRGIESELRQGNIPMLLHPDPQRVCFLGLATGITAGAALDHPELVQLDTAELIPEVAQAARYFAADNNSINDNPKSNIIINDARHYLYGTANRYDLIVSDLFVPWHSQTGYLYTVEHYRAAQARLAEGGLFCQWLPLYQLDAREFEMICDSMAAVFPVVTLWRGEFNDNSFPLMMVCGSDEPPVMDADALTVRIASLPRHSALPDPNLRSVQDLLQLYVGDWPRREGAELNTDDFPRVEFLAPVSNRNSQELTGQALTDYYWEVLLGLQREQLQYIPRRAEPMPDFDEGIHRQLD
ncbi:MAG: fused MFS/spermidine synthase [Planctomycetales bacterium]|nr:fused MFS/spermidine synthase [bacterium]UNM09759.1 MAG: fused MFS/spermidine synthase [Planctomycetales bacterium]